MAHRALKAHTSTHTACCSCAEETNANSCGYKEGAGVLEGLQEKDRVEFAAMLLVPLGPVIGGVMITVNGLRRQTRKIP
jgi:hypothetical protein